MSLSNSAALVYADSVVSSVTLTQTSLHSILFLRCCVKHCLQYRTDLKNCAQNISGSCIAFACSDERWLLRSQSLISEGCAAEPADCPKLDPVLFQFLPLAEVFSHHLLQKAQVTWITVLQLHSAFNQGDPFALKTILEQKASVTIYMCHWCLLAAFQQTQQ